MDNMNIYESSRTVPKEALKIIQGGRLKGKSDINPMWRIKKLTELFGASGIGWYIEVIKQWVEQGENSEKMAFCNINLYIKNGEEWSKPIFGTGGSSMVAKEKNSFYNSDECFKMAYTDAISVACKALGFAADVYYEKDSTKYDSPNIVQEKTIEYNCEKCGAEIKGIKTKSGDIKTAKEVYDSLGGLCIKCYRQSQQEVKQDDTI